MVLLACLAAASRPSAVRGRVILTASPRAGTRGQDRSTLAPRHARHVCPYADAEPMAISHDHREDVVLMISNSGIAGASRHPHLFRGVSPCAHRHDGAT